MANWNRFKWIGSVVYVLAFIGLYYYLRYRTNLWNQHRWIGFALGLVVALGFLSSLRQDFKNEYLARRDHLVLGIFLLITGTISLGTFAFGGTGTDAFLGLLWIGLGAHYTYGHRRAVAQISRDAVQKI